MKFELMVRYWSAILWLWTLSSSAQVNPAAELSSTNYDRLQSFRAAVENSGAPVTVLAFGDSVAETYRSVQLFLFQYLQARLGSSGYSLLPSGAWWEPLAGASLATPSSNWWTLHSIVPPGGTMIFKGNEGASQSVTCNTLGVFWIAQPNGGAFALSISTNGGQWSLPLLTLDGNSTTPTGRFQRLDLPKALYQMRIDGITGTNLILGPRFVDTTTPGINVAYMFQDGANLDQVFSISTNVLYPVLSALNPQLVVWHMKELADIGEIDLSNRLNDLGALWKQTVTNGDVLYIGTPYDVHDLISTFTPIQNRLVRDAAIRDGFSYADCMSPCVSYASMTNNGFLDDNIHPSNLCNGFLANLLWSETGFFALRAQRQVTVQESQGWEILRWRTTPGVRYSLQATGDWAAWTEVLGGLGDGTQWSYTNANHAQRTTLFRLRLSSH